MTINYKSDFDFIMRLRDCDGNDLGWPGFDWTARFYSGSKANAYTASCIGGVCTNCFNDDGQIHVVFKHHRLGVGVLNVEFKAELPNEIYPDGVQDKVAPFPLDIELVRGCAPCSCTADVVVMLPYIKFRYEDLTPEQKAELQAPATEAAQRCDEFVAKASAEEAQRVDNERLRVEAEDMRVSQESERESAEATRRANESERITAESQRKEAESERQSAESARAEEFATWQGEIDTKANRTELSNVLAKDFGEDFEVGETTYPQLFIDLWNEAWGEYGSYDPENAPDPQHPFLGNKIWLTYEEAIDVILISGDWKSETDNLNYKFANIDCRTVLPIKATAQPHVDYLMFRSANIEVITFSKGITPCSGNCYYTFSGCKKLREIIGIVGLNQGVVLYGIFDGCSTLENVRIYHAHQDISFKDSPLLSLESITHLISYRQSSNAIVITVHQDVYAKLTGDTTNDAAASLSPEELALWQQILPDAAAKNITFATV